MAVRIAVGNNKGGVGKSTLVVRLAEALAKLGKRVLVLDFDPQGNTSRRFGWAYDPTNPQLTSSEIIASGAEGVAAQAIQPIGWDCEYATRIALIPCRDTLEDRAVEAGKKGSWRRLVKALKGADANFDYVLIDCPPSLGHLTEMALAAADKVLISTHAEYESVESAVRFRDFIALSLEDISNPTLTVAGVVVAAYEQRTSGQRGQLAGARGIFGDLIWGVVPLRSTLNNANEFAQPLSEVSDSAEIRAVFELIAARCVKEIAV
ncbi:ParA family protein [Streptomyces sp. NPDC053720]|uniref:ParA family protein n=1 Tax=Streptomyces sp. NPDC053720 TaxID=3154855 RepID=UPI003436C681